MTLSRIAGSDVHTAYQVLTGAGGEGGGLGGEGEGGGLRGGGGLNCSAHGLAAPESTSVTCTWPVQSCQSNSAAQQTRSWHAPKGTVAAVGWGSH